MEYLIIAIIMVMVIILMKFVFDINLKKIKQICKNEKLDELTKKYPENIEICKWFLKKLNNENVKIEENTSKQSCLYIAITNKILIANIKDTYTRIQTIAHECLHSIQEKRMLKFNFVFSNIYLLYFCIISIMAILKVATNSWMILLNILIIFSVIYLVVRIYLENDAMIKAKYLAKEYMEEIQISSKEEIEKIISEYEKINLYGIKGTNYYLFSSTCTKIIIFSLICFIRIVAF